MNLRPPGYEPGELPDCSTPRRGRQSTKAAPDYDDPVPWWTLVSLALFGAVLVISTVVIFIVAVRTSRAVREVRATLGGEIGGLLVATEGVQHRIELLAERRAVVESRLARLERSKRKLDVLVWALRDVRSLVARVRGAMPLT